MLNWFTRQSKTGPEGEPLEAAIRRQIDDVRERHGLGRLRADPALERAAYGHSRAMAEHRFFSHDSPLPGLTFPVDRVRAEDGRYQGVGENLALLSGRIATAERFVDGWMKSPGHRANILTPAWETTGVGVFKARDATVYATQLFGVPARLVLDVAELHPAGPRWKLRVRMRIGAGYSLAAFTGYRMACSVEADARGEVVVEVDVPSGSEEGRVTFSRRRTGDTAPWIDIHAAEIERRNKERPVLAPAATRRDSRFQLVEQLLVGAPADVPRLYLRGRTRETAILVVADQVVQRIEPGSFEIAHPLDHRGTQRIALGFPDTATRYLVAHQFDADPATGKLEEIDWRSS